MSERRVWWALTAAMAAALVGSVARQRAAAGEAELRVLLGREAEVQARLADGCRWYGAEVKAWGAADEVGRPPAPRLTQADVQEAKRIRLRMVALRGE
ncbi:MAG: hypothetical protein JWO31_3244 [Phycisphaerales bacterium]|nr:hypothetical protein [Phycisphaerales bacterium]